MLPDILIQTWPMPTPPPEGTPPAVKPLPKLVQYAILAVMLALAGVVVWLVRPSRKPCTVKETFHNDNICIVTGSVKVIDEVNKALNAKQLGSVELDEVELTDPSGSRSVYFDPQKFDLGGRTTAKVTGREVQEHGSPGVTRFVVEEVE
ncbi:MAG TPA: hypothetical protein VM694_20150 [Polyangium sp.]|nr:hypothetical protein [Polyangium sp.]